MRGGYGTGGCVPNPGDRSGSSPVESTKPTKFKEVVNKTTQKRNSKVT